MHCSVWIEIKNWNWNWNFFIYRKYLFFYNLHSPLHISALVLFKKPTPIQMILIENAKIFIFHYWKYFKKPQVPNSVINPFLPECKTTFSQIFYAIFKFLKPEHDCYVKFTSCSTQGNIKKTLWGIKYQLNI